MDASTNLVFEDTFKKASPELKELFLLIDKTIKAFGNDVTSDNTETHGYVRYFRKSKNRFLEITIQPRVNDLEIWVYSEKDLYSDPRNILVARKKYDCYGASFKIKPSSDWDYAVSLLKQAYDLVRE